MDRLFHIGMITLLGIGFIFCTHFLYKGRNICKTPRCNRHIHSESYSVECYIPLALD